MWSDAGISRDQTLTSRSCRAQKPGWNRNEGYTEASACVFFLTIHDPLWPDMRHRWEG